MIKRLLPVAAVLCWGCSDGKPEQKQDLARIRMEQELAVVQPALVTQPESPELYFARGQIFERYGLIDSAVGAYERSVSLHEAFPEAHSRLGDLHFQRQELALATSAYEQATRFAPDDAELHNNLGFVYRRQGLLTQAIGAYQRALDCDSMMVEAINNLGQVYRESGDTVAAAASFRRAMRVDADFPPAYVNLARMLQEGGVVEQEKTVLEQMVARFGSTSKEGSYAQSRLEEIGDA